MVEATLKKWCLGCFSNLKKFNMFIQQFNQFPHDKILDQTKLKAFADDKLNVTKMVISVFHRVEKIEGKGEIACTSNFSFSHIVFQRLLSQMCQKVSLCGNGLTHYQTTNFRVFQSESICRRQFQIWRKWQKVIQMGRKQCGKRRNCSLWAISPFPTVFSKGFFPRCVKRCHCVGMG